MATKVLTGAYPHGYSAAPGVDAVRVTTTGVLLGPALKHRPGSALKAAGGLTLTNSGSIEGDAGLNGKYPAAYPTPGGPGSRGVRLAGVSRVVNDGVISGGAGGNGGTGYYQGPYVDYGGGGPGGAGGVGIDMAKGGILINRARVTGGAGGEGGPAAYNGGAGGDGAAAVRVGASATITNTGVLQGGAAGAGENFYSVPHPASGGDGLLGTGGTVTLRNAGSIIGGDEASLGALAGAGVDLADGSIVNNGLLLGGGGTDAGLAGAGGAGVIMRGSGRVSNNGGSIMGGVGAAMQVGGVGVDLVSGGSLSNRALIAGGAGGVGAEIPSSTGAYLGGRGGVGVVLGPGGSILNLATIEGGSGGAGGVGPAHSPVGGAGGVGGAGVNLRAGSSVLNQATIEGGGGGAGGEAEGAGATGGAGGVGGEGAILSAAATVTNLGSILGGAGGTGGEPGPGNTTGAQGAAGADGVGILLKAGGVIANGNGAHTGALISGRIGVDVTGSAAVTVTNFGTIQGSVASVRFGSSADRLIAMSGADFVGAMRGGGGTLELDGGTGAISSFGDGGVLSGDDQGSFSGFATYEFEAGGDWTAARVSLAGGDLARDAGSLTVDGDVKLAAGSQLDETKAGVITVDSGFAVTNAGQIAAEGSGGIVIQDGVFNTGELIAGGGDLTITGDVTGDGSASIRGGLLSFDGAFSQNVAFVGASPGGTLALKDAVDYRGAISGFSADGATALDLMDVGFTSADEATFRGDASHGLLTVSDGTNTATIKLAGDYVGDTFTAKSDGHGGVIVTASDPGASAGAAQLVQAIASFGAGPDPPSALQAPIGPVQADPLIAPSTLRTMSGAARG